MRDQRFIRDLRQPFLAVLLSAALLSILCFGVCFAGVDGAFEPQGGVFRS